MAAESDARWEPFESSSTEAVTTGEPKWKYVLVRTCQYLNNIIERDLGLASKLVIEEGLGPGPRVNSVNNPTKHLALASANVPEP